MLEGKFLMIKYEMIPTAIPVAMPENINTGKYRKSFGLCTIIAAMVIWPKLWNTPPHILTPTILNLSVRFNRYINDKLSIPPAREYMAAKKPLKSSPAITILITFTKNAVLKSYTYKATSITTLAIPIFIPGIPKLNGISIST